MLIRDEKAGDEPAISQLHYSAFEGHPQHQPGAEPTEHLIVERLRAAGDLSLSLVAEDEGEILGHIALSPASLGQTLGRWFLLGPVGVLPPHQGRGIGSALVRESLARMRARGAAGVVLVGEPDFYNRFGFRSLPGLIYPGVPGQYVLAVSFGNLIPQGEIVHHPAFD